MSRLLRNTLGAMAVAAMALPFGASAAVLTFDLDTEFSGATPPAGTPPWITATFDDSFGGPNTVRLTMSATNLVGVEFVGGWYFNFDPALNAASLTVTGVSTAAVGTTTISRGNNLFKADGDGFFDILFDFPPPPGAFAGKFTAGESVVYDLTYISPITASSFDFLSLGDGNSPSGLRTAAHVQGIGTSGDDSGWITGGNGNGKIPEPASLMIFALGLIGLGFLARRRLASVRV